MVLLGRMTPDYTTAAVARFCKLDRQFPVHGTIRHRQSDMFLLIGGMGMVAGLTASPLHFLIDMKVVQVDITVPEICKGRRFRFQRDILIVAFKAHGIVLGIIRHIEFVGEVFLQ